MRATTVLAVFCTAMPFVTSAEETALGIDEKLKAVYDLYRVNDTVTLKRQEFNVGLMFGYAVEETRVFGIQETARTLSASVSMSYGLTDAVQLSLALPFLYETATAEDATTTYLDASTSGIGNATLGVAASFPTTSFSTTLLGSATLPTGDNDKTVTSFGFTVDKVMQPAFVYGGASWVRDWDADRDTLGYSAGVGFFLNHALTIGAGLEGGFALNPEQGSARDTLSFMGRVSYQATPSFGITPSLAIGLAGNAPDVSLGLSMLWRF